MDLEVVVTLANKKCRLQFLALERSLRATGCQLPLWVIPYNDDLFDLPANATWWELPEITGWLGTMPSHPLMRKYQCLTIKNYQLVDTDACFLRNPADVLKDASGFVTSCGHWHNPGPTMTAFSKKLITRRSTVWQPNIFNSGQYACDTALYDAQTLKSVAEQDGFRETCTLRPMTDQQGMNLLVHQTGIEIHNLTLPPTRMESTWAGDYPGEYLPFWKDESKKPYLIHYAGKLLEASLPINEIYLGFLTREERVEWDEHVRVRREASARAAKPWRKAYRRLTRVLQPSPH